MSNAQKDAADHIAIARAVREAIGSEDVLFHQHAFYCFRERGVWAKVDDREIQSAIHDVLGRNDVKFGRSMVDSVMDLLRTECYLPEHAFNLGGDIINTTSGTVVWSADRWTLRPYLREDYLTVQIPVPYDSEAKCLRFTAFLQEVFAGDKDGYDKVSGESPEHRRPG